jgi:expansin (peptidoglycan-binding protein)
MGRSFVAAAVAVLALGCGSGSSGRDATRTVPIGEPQEGIATYYDFADGSGACMFDPSPDDLDVAALNAVEYSNAAYCGACAHVEGPSGEVTVRLVDLCPECQAGHLDLSPVAFEQIAALELGRVDITWTLTACDVSGPVAYKYKDGSNPWWTGVQVRNHRYPITRLEVDKGSGFVEVERTEYNYFVDESGFGSDAVTVRITATTGETLVDTLPPVEAELVVDGAAQFQ